MHVHLGNAIKLDRLSVNFQIQAKILATRQSWSGNRTGQKRLIPVRIPALLISWSTTGGSMAWDEMGWG